MRGSEGILSRVLHNSTPHSVHLSVHLSVRLSVRPSVCWSVACLNSCSPFYFIGIFELLELTVPAQMPLSPFLSVPLPALKQLGQPCIHPCLLKQKSVEFSSSQFLRFLPSSAPPSV